MPLMWVPPKIFLEFGGVTIYHCYKEQDYNQKLDYWYTTDAHEDSEVPNMDFDVRDLHSKLFPGTPFPDCPITEVTSNHDSHKKIIEIAIKRGGYLTLTRSSSEGAKMIMEERCRQVNEEGWTPEHDDQHISGDLAVHAAALAVYGTDAELEDPLDRVTDTKRDSWGLIEKHRNNPIRMLVIAGALIAAEIDRMLRHGGKDEDNEQVEE